MISAIILAAGRSTRMGRPKQILKLGSLTLLEHVLRSFRAAGIDEIVIVLGTNADQIIKTASLTGARIVINKDYLDGLSTSVRAGIDAVDPRTEAVIVGLADQPFLAPMTIRRLIDGYRASGKAIVAPLYAGTQGNPVLFDRSMFRGLRRLQGDAGAKPMVNRNRDKLFEVEVDDEGILTDIDTPKDYAKAKKFHSSPSRGASP